MVVVQRRTTCPPRPFSSNTTRRQSSCEVSSGIATENSIFGTDTYDQPSWHLSTKASRRRSSNLQGGSIAPPIWVIIAAMGLTLVSCLACSRSTAKTSLELGAIKEQHHLAVIQHTQLLKKLSDMEREFNSGIQKLKKLRKIKRALTHETNVISEMGDAWEAPTGGHIQKWITERTNTLGKRVTTLKKYLQKHSKSFVKNQFGAGPHRVKFTVDIPNANMKSQRKSFVVALASVEKMPHSVHFFLDMVKSGIWNNTVFLHHEDVDHVMAAAPIDYLTHKIKFKELNTLAWDGLGFPEYDPSFPHSKYTLGFADRGPTFYINTKDNTKTHGPGGQGHHTLPTDADPCFARVVEGTEAVEELVSLGLQNHKFDKDGLHPWADDEHHWTHILSVEIL